MEYSAGGRHARYQLAEAWLRQQGAFAGIQVREASQASQPLQPLICQVLTPLKIELAQPCRTESHLNPSTSRENCWQFTVLHLCIATTSYRLLTENRLPDVSLQVVCAGLMCSCLHCRSWK